MGEENHEFLKNGRGIFLRGGLDRANQVEIAGEIGVGLRSPQQESHSQVTTESVPQAAQPSDCDIDQRLLGFLGFNGSTANHCTW